jgi:nucleotide-binding universal stress UspA family protein
MRILLATDGSANAAIAAALVENIPWPLDSSIDVVRVLEDPVLSGVEGPWPMALPVASDIQTAAVQDAEDALLGVVEPLRNRGLSTAHAVLHGRPASALLDWIDRHRPDLVVVGTRGSSVLTQALVGSVSAELIDRSPVPVLVARRPILERVVVAVDGSEIASEAVSTVKRWPFLAAMTIRTLSVAPEPMVWWPDRFGAGSTDQTSLDRDAAVDVLDEHRVIAAEAAATLRAAGFEARPEIRSGPPGPTIVAFAAEGDADLVIMGSHGRTGVARLLLGSVARHVLHHSSCSVLVVRQHPDPVRGKRMAKAEMPWTLAPAH